MFPGRNYLPTSLANIANQHCQYCQKPLDWGKNITALFDEPSWGRIRLIMLIWSLVNHHGDFFDCAGLTVGKCWNVSWHKDSWCYICSARRDVAYCRRITLQIQRLNVGRRPRHPLETDSAPQSRRVFSVLYGNRPVGYSVNLRLKARRRLANCSRHWRRATTRYESHGRYFPDAVSQHTMARGQLTIRGIHWMFSLPSERHLSLSTLFHRWFPTIH